MTDLASPTETAWRPLSAPCQAAIGRITDATTILHLTGVLDGQSSRHFNRTMRTALLAAPRTVVVDLSAVTHINRAGALLLILMRRHASRHAAALSIAGTTPTVAEALRELGVTHLLRFHPTTAAAINASPSAPGPLSGPALPPGVPTERPRP